MAEALSPLREALRRRLNDSASSPDLRARTASEPKRDMSAAVNRHVRTVLLWCALWLPGAVLAHGSRLAAILEDQRVHGYPSPSTAMAQLRGAADVPAASAPVELRRRYEGALAELAILGQQPALATTSLARLQHMAEQEHCAACAVTWHSLAARAALEHPDLGVARNHLALAKAALGAAGADGRLHYLHAAASFERAAGSPGAAVARALAAATLAERTGSGAEHVRLMILMAVIDADLGYLDRARTLVDEAYRQAKTMRFTEAMALAQLDEAYIESLSDHHERQRRLLESALALAQRTPGLDYIAVGCLSNLADHAQHQGDYAAMLRHASRGVVLARRIGDDTGLVFALANEGIALGELGRIDDATPKLKASIDLADRLGMQVHVVGITHELVRLLERAGRYREALDAMHRSEAASEQLTRQEREKAVLELQEKYASERKTREIERLSAENRLRAAELAARTWKQWLWAALALAFALAAVLLLQWLRRQARRLREDNAHLAEEVLHDPLTGAGNRRHFERLVARYEHAGPGDPDLARTGVVGLMVIDIDHFKAVNDQHGHEAGDTVLVEVTRRLRALLREQDAVVRWGGEEFVLVLPGTSVSGLGVLAGRVLRVIGETPIEAGGRTIRVTVSAGAVAHPVVAGAPVDAGFRLSDAAMYLAKQRGRNRALCVEALDATSVLRACDDLVAAERSGAIALRTVSGPEKALETVA
jgi:diguanylate cyclase (GGDEF)-like protein